MTADLRGSKHQHHLFELLSSHYGHQNVIWELVLNNGLRVDIFIKHLGIAIEYDGEQHYKYNEHFHGDLNGYISSINRDMSKEELLTTNGVKIVRFRGDTLSLTIEDILNAIDSVNYPSVQYDFSGIVKIPNNEINEKLRQYRKEQYKKYKLSQKNK